MPLRTPLRTGLARARASIRNEAGHHLGEWNATLRAQRRNLEQVLGSDTLGRQPGCATKKASDFKVEKIKKPEHFFRESDDEPDYSVKKVKRCREAAEIFKTLHTTVKIGMDDSFITSPTLYAGGTKPGFLTGVIAIRVDT